MSELMRVLDLLSKEDTYEDTTKLFVSYKADKGKEVLCKNLTGNYEQVFETEENMLWNLFLLKDKSKTDSKQGKAYLIGRCVTSKRLLLSSDKKCYKNAVKIMNSICEKCYSNNELGLKATAMTVQIYKNLLRDLKLPHTRYWLANQGCINTSTECESGIIYYGINYSELGNEKLFKMLYKSSDSYSEASEMNCICEDYPIRVVVPLPKDIFVELGNPEKDGSSPEKALKLFRPSKEAWRLYENTLSILNKANIMREESKRMEKEAKEMLKNVKKILLEESSKHNI